MVHDTAAPPTYAPLVAQRRRLRDRALAILYGRHSGPAAEARPDEPRPAPPTGVVGSAASESEAALAQRLTGPGSGPYSGTPFRPAAGASENGRPSAAGSAPSEAARHDHGIIDHSRHVSSIGRR